MLRRAATIGALAAMVLTAGVALERRAGHSLVASSSQVVLDLADSALWHAITQIKVCLSPSTPHDSRPLRPRV